MKAHFVSLCLLTSALALGGCATTVAPLFPTSHATVKTVPELSDGREAYRSMSNVERPARSHLANGMACRSE